MKNGRKKEARAKAELVAVRVACEFATKKHNVAQAKVREEQPDEVDARKETTLRIEATLARVCEKTSAEVKKFRSDRDSAASCHHKLLAFIRLIVKAREERKDKAVDTLAKLRKIYDEGRKVTIEAHRADWGDLGERVAL